MLTKQQCRVAGVLGCCSEGTGKSMRSNMGRGGDINTPQEPHSLSCGIGVGLDPALISERRGAVVIALADGGAAHKEGGIKLGDKIIKIDTLDVPRMMQDDAVKGSGGASSYCATELASALLVLLPSCFALILRTLEVTEFLTTPTGRVWFAGGGCG